MTSSAQKVLKILIVDDNDFIRLGIKTALNTVGTISVIGEANNGLEAIQRYSELNPDVVLMDIEMPVMNGIACTRAIKQVNAAAKVIMLTSHDEEGEVHKALSAGANGYCLKDVALQRLHDGIRAVHAGDLWLDSAVAGKVVKLCSSSPVGQAEDPQSLTLPYGTLTEIEREIMNLLVNGFTTTDISNRLQLSLSTAKAYVVNVLNKVTAVKELAEPSSEGGGVQPLDFVRDTTLTQKYELVGRLGAGGMSVVFKARHKHLSRMVAVKLLNGEAFRNAGVQKRFLQEAQITSNMSHPSIVTVYDFGINMDGQPYIVMDFVDGPTLAQLLERGGPIPEREAIRIFSQVASALAYAHSKGVVHRDIKPGNVMVSFQPGEFTVKILDFGLAQIDHKDDVEAQKITQAGCALGSPLYMSPEQCQGHSVDSRSDVYSFGCLMYEVLKGRPPFRGATAIDTMRQHVNERVPTLEDVVSSEKLRYLINKCLAKSPTERFATAQDLSQELLSALV